MTKPTRLVFFSFCGRKANMEIQRPYIEALLAAYPTAEFHMWDLTRDPDDQFYLRQRAAEHEQVVYVDLVHTGHPIACTGDYRGRGHRPCTCMKHKPPYEQPYRYYRDHPHRGSNVPNYDDETVLVKLDDDVLWMDVDRFDEVLAFLETHPDAIASANVTNNAVCAKYEPSLTPVIQDEFRLGNPINPDYDRDWWALHTSVDFAKISHAWLLDKSGGYNIPSREPFRTRDGESVSINFVAMKYPVLKHAANLMQNGGRLGDEGTIDSMNPWIIPNFRVAHLSFGPQEKGMTEDELDAIRNTYKEVS